VFCFFVVEVILSKAKKLQPKKINQQKTTDTTQKMYFFDSFCSFVGFYH